jgi:hypothetical protein
MSRRKSFRDELNAVIRQAATIDISGPPQRIIRTTALDVHATTADGNVMELPMTRREEDEPAAMVGRATRGINPALNTGRVVYPSIRLAFGTSRLIATPNEQVLRIDRSLSQQRGIIP